ncbi:Ribosomal_protein L26 [Hexamita inflata]|uniref:Ribosomal protein L26 n=1 Tax=Hexamita inflata TaxID=28002 RepID=A0AA86REF2_9EUKA|nr:Ribosomal protein L26 [Hexamita inflata]
MKFNNDVTGQRRKQRKAIYTAPSHLRAKLMVSRLAETLRTEYKVTNMPICKGDVVKVLVGGKKVKVTGKVTAVDRKNYKIYVEGANHKARKEADKAKQIPIHPSNCLITELYPVASRLRAISRRNGKEFVPKAK